MSRRGSSVELQFEIWWWLKLLDRALTVKEVRYVQEMARRIAAILLLEPDLHANYRTIKKSAYPW